VILRKRRIQAPPQHIASSGAASLAAPRHASWPGPGFCRSSCLSNQWCLREERYRSSATARSDGSFLLGLTFLTDRWRPFLTAGCNTFSQTDTYIEPRIDLGLHGVRYFGPPSRSAVAGRRPVALRASGSGGHCGVGGRSWDVKPCATGDAGERPDSEPL
jgi:hypothetical protein